MKVTAKNIPELGAGLHSVGDRLYLRVYSSANRNPSWVYIYFISNKRFELSLGTYPKVKLPKAKSRAARYTAMLDDGIDPRDNRDDTKEQLLKKRTPPYTFSNLLTDALPVILETKQCRNEKHAAQWRSTLMTYALPILGNRAVDKIDRDDVLEVLKPIWYEKNETANRVRGRLEAVFNYAIATGKYKAMNPCVWRGNLDMFLPSPSKVSKVDHHEALTFDEARSLVARWRDPAERPITASAILFGMLTAARVGEFVPAKWDEIDFDAAVWSCPPERRKDGKPYPHRVPLSTQALELLNALPRENEYIFPSPIESKYQHINKESPRLMILKALGHGTMHGLRSTFRDWAAETGQDMVLSEKSLMHATGNAVSQAYQRSDLLEQRRPIMQAWADALFEE